MKLENIDNFLEDLTLGDSQYKIAYFFESKDDPSLRIQLKSNLIKHFVYIDDIAHVGLTGQFIIENSAGIFNDILSNTDRFYIGFYSKNLLTNYEENIYFSIISSDAIGSSSNSVYSNYKLLVEEAFMVEGANKIFKFLSLGMNNSILQQIGSALSSGFGLFKSAGEESVESSDKTLDGLANLILTLIKSKIGVPEGTQSGDKLDTGIFFNDFSLGSAEFLKRIIDVDDVSFNLFANDYKTEKIGTALYEFIKNEDSCLHLLNLINSNFYISKNEESDDEVFGDIGTARNENISEINKIDSKNYTGLTGGERKFILKNIKNLFEKCFKDKIVYEKLINNQNMSLPNDIENIKGVYTLQTGVNNLKNFPINIALINKIWCDLLIAPSEGEDDVTRTFLSFKDVLEFFKKDYLNNLYDTNIVIDDKILKNRGIQEIEPCYGKDELLYTACSKIIKSLITLNETTEINLPGNSYRKANEIMCIDPNILSSENDSGGTNTTYNNSLKNKFYYITRVEHNIIGTQYNNTITLCAFCKDKE